MARGAADGGLQVDLADTLEMADEEGVDGEKIAGEAGLDVAFAELGREALEGPDLVAGEISVGVVRDRRRPTSVTWFSAFEA